jgi:hypothetical protein
MHMMYLSGVYVHQVTRLSIPLGTGRNVGHRVNG